jgi:hypothetical protein
MQLVRLQCGGALDGGFTAEMRLLQGAEAAATEAAAAAEAAEAAEVAAAAEAALPTVIE